MHRSFRCVYPLPLRYRKILFWRSLPWASAVPFCACTLLLATTTWRCAARRPRTGRLLLTTTKTKTQTSDAAALADFAKAIRLRGVAGDLMRRLLGGAPLLRYEEWLSISCDALGLPHAHDTATREDDDLKKKNAALLAPRGASFQLQRGVPRRHHAAWRWQAHLRWRHLRRCAR